MCKEKNTKTLFNLTNHIGELKVKLRAEKVKFDEGMALFRSLENLPEENQLNMLAMDYTKGSKIADIYQEWGRRGYLKFEPYISGKSANPTLTVRHNVHIQLHEGMYFQASEAPNAAMIENGSVRIDDFFKYEGGEKSWAENSLYFNILCYAAFMDVALHYQNVSTWLFEHTDMVDAYVHMAYEFHGIHLTYGWRDFAPYTIVEHGKRISVDRNIYRVAGTKGTVCEFAFGTDSIEVLRYSDFYRTSVMRLEIPDILEGIKEDGNIAKYASDVMYSTVGTVKYRRDLLMLIIMLLKLMGVHLNWLNVYALSDTNTVAASNIPGTVKVSSLEDVYKYSPDSY